MRDGVLELVRDLPVDVALEKVEEREVEPGALSHPADGALVVGQSVVVQEEPGGDVEGDEDVDGVVLVGGEDEEDAENVADPREGVEEVDAARGVVRYEEVEQGQSDRVAAEHVVPASADSLETRVRSVATPISQRCNLPPIYGIIGNSNITQRHG